METEVTASNSHAAMAYEIAELRRALWALIAAGKAVVRDVKHTEKQAMLLGALMEAERKVNQ
jgi:hypothetical protein